MSVPSPELPRPLPARTWRQQLAGLAESFDVSPRRLVVGAVALACIGVLGWRLLAPPPPPAEMRLPFAQSSAAGDSAGSPGAAGGGDGGDTGGAATTGTAAATEVVVHVAGAVASPGVRRLPPGSRVVDALDAAGGALPDAELARVNLAAPLVDGQQVYVPKPGEQPPVAAGAGVPGGAGAGGAAGSGGAIPGTLVNLNTATAEQLDTLPGVGPTTAAAIIAHRDQHGPFTSVDQLVDVRGIGAAKLAQLRDLVAV